MRARDEPGAERTPLMRDTARLPGWLGEISFHREAERVTSLGKDWHRPCLKCEKCKKTLSAGSHAEKLLSLHLTCHSQLKATTWITSSTCTFSLDLGLRADSPSRHTFTFSWRFELSVMTDATIGNAAFASSVLRGNKTKYRNREREREESIKFHVRRKRLEVLRKAWRAGQRPREAAWL
ncbi:Cysteine-rich protein 1 [Collichthys lucidus]|uniref:Cysteine-rich protein 1 n=1 Tax=Collichthys lucidus TaxID=240159 RepID=A0A4U5VFE8_COLLU|nr:Cysteine-rich protein 1 [Collichthys lucidus]